MEKENQIEETAKEEHLNDSQEDNKEISDDEQLEIEREIADYEHKISALDEKIAEYKKRDINEMKKRAMKDFYYTDEQIERYIGHIEGTSADEIKQSVIELVADITPAGDNFADPSPFNGRAAKPKTVDHAEIGRRAFDRVKHKIFPWMRGR